MSNFTGEHIQAFELANVQLPPSYVNHNFPGKPVSIRFFCYMFRERTFGVSLGVLCVTQPTV